MDIPISSIRFSKTSASASTVEIEFPLLQTLCKEIQYEKDQIQTMTARIFQDILRAFEPNISLLEILANYVAKMDVALTKMYVAKKYHYCCPTLVSTENEKSFVDAVDLRHALIEHIQEDELYVANDICFGGSTKIDGILLYGTNAVGKTSFIRALGIAIIMAQSGFYVPCSQFRYRPYTAIFSRILGNDNLFKGMSSFAVEMSELRIILKHADQNSLVLGDELCSGTELVSALSLFVSGLIRLHQKRASFLFATHFHEITKYEEIKNMKRLALKHMQVVYDRERDVLVYDRKIKDGSGTSTYGLEVCKSLYMEPEFMELAFSIRNKYHPEMRGELVHPVSRYNAKKVRGMCEICGMQIGIETHHKIPQRQADADGFIGTFHKNHPANLLSVCHSCHLTVHRDDDSSYPVKSEL